MSNYVKWDEFVEEESELKFWGMIHKGARRQIGILI
jgi:hypothetical protein